MERLIFVTLLFVGGCSFFSQPIRIQTEVQETLVPVMFCPSPQKHVRPVLAISELTHSQLLNPGEVAKHYQATIEQLIGYARELELELDKYNSDNTAYNDLKKQTNEKFLSDGVTTPILLNQINE